MTSSDLGRRQERWRKGRQRWGGGVRGQREDKEIDKRSNREMDWKGSKWIGKGEKEGAREMQVGKRESRLTVKVDGDWWWHSSGLHGDECLMPWRLCLRMVNNESTINNNSSSQAGCSFKLYSRHENRLARRKRCSRVIYFVFLISCISVF